MPFGEQTTPLGAKQPDPSSIEQDEMVLNGLVMDAAFNQQVTVRAVLRKKSRPLKFFALLQAGIARVGTRANRPGRRSLLIINTKLDRVKRGT